MKPPLAHSCKRLLLLATACWLPSASVHALVNTSELLILEPGENLTLSGTVFRSVSIQVKAGAGIQVAPYDGGGVNLGSLNLVAPSIVVEGGIHADGVAYYDQGAGGAPSGDYYGGGGGGYGGGGGRGAKGSGGTAGTGGTTYGSYYLEDTGSYGWRAGYGDSHAGYGGGCIRLDAIHLTLAGSAVLSATGNPNTYQTVGGGSGGCVYLNGIYSIYSDGYLLDASGGGGGGGRVSERIGAAGGGGGGRIKSVKNVVYQNFSGKVLVEGGLSGGGNAVAGSLGTTAEIPAPLPNAPVLLSPLEGQTVGTAPTFNFMTTDALHSKFFKYRVLISRNPSFTPVTACADQMFPDPGWSNKDYFFTSELAGYALQQDLTAGSTYYWSVSVTTDEGNHWVDAGGHKSFITINNSRPVKPVIIQPASLQKQVAKTPAFKVLSTDPDGNTLTFTLILSKDPQLSNPQTFQATYPGWNASFYPPASAYAGVTATCQILNAGGNLDALVPGTDYYWKVVVYDTFQQSCDSDICHFRTVDRPTTPVIIAPLPGSVSTTKNPRLQIVSESPTSGNLNYRIELSSDNFQTVTLFQSVAGGGWTQASYPSAATAELAIPPAAALISGQTYAWRASAYDSANDNWSLVTDPAGFSVLTPPLLPQLTFPENNYAAPSSRLVFQFEFSTDAGNTVNGRLEISDDQFQTVLRAFDQTQSPAGWSEPYFYSNSPAAFALPDTISLERGKTYWWRVFATDGLSWGPASESRSFRLAESLDLQSVQIIPNPAVSVDAVQIRLQLSVDAEVTIRFYNRLGKEVDQFQARALGGLQGNWFQYDISRYASGIYFYVVEARSAFGTKKISRKFAVVN